MRGRGFQSQSEYIIKRSFIEIQILSSIGIGIKLDLPFFNDRLSDNKFITVSKETKHHTLAARYSQEAKTVSHSRAESGRLDLVVSCLDSDLLIAAIAAFSLLLRSAGFLKRHVTRDSLLDERRLIRPEVGKHDIGHKGGCEAPNVKHVVDVFSTSNAGLQAWVDGSSHAGQVGNDGDEEGSDGAPVGAGFIVPVAPAGLVERWDIDVCLLHDPIVGAHDCGNVSEEGTETCHEGEKGGGRVDDLPGYHDPSCCYCCNDDSTTDVDVLWEEGGHVVGAGDNVG